MSEKSFTQLQKTNTKFADSDQSTLIQRKCACGQHTVASDECEPCRKERLRVQRWDKNHAGPALLTADFATAANTMTPRFGADFTRVQLRTSQPFIQRMPRGEPASISAEPTADQGVAVKPAAVSSPKPVEATPTSEPATELAAPNEAAVPSLLVEDYAADLGEGQMRKSEFLGELRTAVCTAADAELAAAGRDTEGCPYLDYWFDYYGQRDAVYIERALSRYAPKARTATNAREYIPLIAERVRQGVARWVRTGEVSSVPEGVPTTVPGEPPAESSLAVQAKARPGGAKLDDDPAAIRDQLGDGRPLDSGVRSRMESAFGTSFSHVRMHNNNNAANLSSSQNARAFTVGEHVAFGASEYKPGTLLGDALIAHELAHVVQQGTATESVANMEVGDIGYDALEKDADRTAVSAVTTLWGKSAQTLQGIQQQAMPTLRSGLRLQRCSCDGSGCSKRSSPSRTTSGTTGGGALGNAYGNWDITQSNTDGSSATSNYQSAVKIKFNPEPTQVNCDEIAFVQNVRSIDTSTKKPNEPRLNFFNRITKTGWTIDRLDKKKYGWYGYNNDGKPSGTVTTGSSPKPLKSATLSDIPGWNVPDLIWDFETCSICKNGTDSNLVYGCLTWGFTADSSNKLKSHTPAHSNKPSAEFNDAIKQWNLQAAGPKAKRNAPAQVPLGPFK